MRLRIGKIDWPNHAIGFFSALFGILIAFELDQWRETRNHQEEARNAFDKLKQEIQINKNSLRTSGLFGVARWVWAGSPTEAEMK